ncbi:GlxA-like beta barrel domain-containing protein OS=Streptomyces antimycoticus OX=68175 GN=SSPO_062000 PE=4 SV=1 [Streptomyces antimycoticus]
MNGPALYRFSSDKYHAYKINQPEYKAENGHWDVIQFPQQYRINTIHAALLHTGKVLLVAGSGNNAKNFAAKSFRSVLWDPEKNTFTNIPRPPRTSSAPGAPAPGRKAVGGRPLHPALREAQGRCREGGRTDVRPQRGPRQAQNPPRRDPLHREGERQDLRIAKDPLLVPRATKKTNPKTKKVTVSASTARVYVEALRKGRKYQTRTEDNYRIAGLKGKDRQNFYGIAQKLSFDKKDFQGIKMAYELDLVPSGTSRSIR